MIGKLMKVKLFVIAALALWLLVSGSAMSQDIDEIEAGLWSTDTIPKGLKIGDHERISIKSVSSLMGTIEISVAEQDHISLVYRKQARTDSRSKARDYIDLITVVLRIHSNQARLELRAKNPAPWAETGEAGIVGVKLVLPLNFIVDIDATYFDIVAVGPLLGLTASPSLGEFNVSQVDGELDFSTKNRRVKLTDIYGDISAATTNSPMVVTNARSGKQAAVFRNEGGNIEIEGFTGELNIRNEYGRIDIRDFTPKGDGNFIRGVNGPIKVELTPASVGPLVIRNLREDISIYIPDTLSTYLMLSVDDDGEIIADGFDFTTDLVERNALNLSSGDGVVEINGSIKGKGDIVVSGVEVD